MTMRIGIVNDMGLAREALRRVVLSSSEHEVAWTASDGAEAVELARGDVPDLILMDLFMPGMDGVEATRRIMGESPCAILVVTATVSGHEQGLPGDGLRRARRDRHAHLGSAGGDCRRCPAPAQDRDHRQAPRQAAGAAARGRSPAAFRSTASLAQRPISRSSPWLSWEPRPAAPRPWPRFSRGCPPPSKPRHHRPARRRGIRPRPGPMALRAIAPARDAGCRGTSACLGEILLSGTDDHLVLGEDRRLHYSAEPRDSSYRPSVDVFFASAAGNWPDRASPCS